MSVASVGTDLIECARVGKLLERHPQRFLERVLTPVERAQAERFGEAVPHISGRFAAKEAVLKVLGTGWRGRIAWTDIEITNDPLGQPQVALSGPCAQRADELGLKRVLLSITHTEHYAAATAIGVG
ncbi:MAG: holo-[acyl-carrier-protein] synthase [bacterium]|nr:holo-[acyl-carrier-protein] synthase [bacterium]